MIGILLQKLLPLYIVCIVAYFGSKALGIEVKSISRTQLYFIEPVVMFMGIYETTLYPQLFMLPLYFFFAAMLISLTAFALGKIIWKKDPTANLLGFAACIGNVGVFSLTFILFLLGDEAFALAIFGMLGLILFEYFGGLFILSSGQYSLKEASAKILKLPSLYAIFLAFFCKAIQADLFFIPTTLIDQFKGAYVLLGMILLGVALPRISQLKFDFKFIRWAFVFRFVLWPLVSLLFIFLDQSVLHWFTPQLYTIIIFLSVVPLAIDTIIFSLEFNVYPHKAANAVMLSTVFGMVYLPVAIGAMFDFLGIGI